MASYDVWILRRLLVVGDFLLLRKARTEVATSVLGGFDLDVSRVIYAIGSLSSAGLIHTLININHIFPSTDAADHNCFLPITSLNADYHLNT